MLYPQKNTADSSERVSFNARPMANTSSMEKQRVSSFIFRVQRGAVHADGGRELFLRVPALAHHLSQQHIVHLFPSHQMRTYVLVCSYFIQNARIRQQQK